MLLALSLFGLSMYIFEGFGFVYSLTAVGSGTLLCGLAPSMDALIVARAIAGMGGGGYVISSRTALNQTVSWKFLVL